MNTPQVEKQTCLLDHCDKPLHGRGFCQRHLYNYRKGYPLLNYNEPEVAPESDSGVPCRLIHKDIEGKAQYIKNHVSQVHQLVSRAKLTFDTLVMTCGNPDCMEYDHIDFDKSDYR